MKVLYVETSSALAWLLGEPAGDQVLDRIERADMITTSRLTILECRRALVRLEASKRIKAADRQKLIGILEQVSGGWMLIEMVPEIYSRASERLPIEPVRSLDAVHLASALELLKVFPDLHVLSLDERVRSNLQPLGLSEAIL